MILFRTERPSDMPHIRAVSSYPDWLLDAVIDDLGKRNLRNYQDNETRWLAGRASAARAERRRRRHHLATHSIQTEDLPPEETTTP